MDSPRVFVKQAEIFKAPVKLKKPFVISLGRMLFAENIIIRITTSEGLTGFGECSPFAAINGETIDTCFIVGQKIARELIGKDPLDLPECCNLMDKVIYGNSSIKSAFSIALFDIASQSAGKSLSAFLGGRNTTKIITDYTVSIDEPDKMAEDALEIVGKGFRIIKVKVGKSGKKDIERIKQIRKTIGMDIPVRIDANQGWEKDEAVETLIAIDDLGIQFCEEPVPRWMFMELPEIRKQSPVKIMADESCFDHHDAQRLANISACDYFNVKLGKSSGFINAQKIIRIAESDGMQVQIGGFVESRLGFTASAHLALTSENITFFDFDTPLMLEDDPVIGGIQYNAGGEISVPDSIGLGASVDEKFLLLLEKISIR